jgi:hypothetical protein
MRVKEVFQGGGNNVSRRGASLCYQILDQTPPAPPWLPHESVQIPALSPVNAGSHSSFDKNMASS